MTAKRAEPAIASVRESSETFRLLVEHVQDYAIFKLDGAGRVSTWNADRKSVM